MIVFAWSTAAYPPARLALAKAPLQASDEAALAQELKLEDVLKLAVARSPSLAEASFISFSSQSAKALTGERRPARAEGVTK